MQITAQEKEWIGELYESGYNVQEISEKLHIPVNYVKYHAGELTNSLPKEYIENEEKRKEAIKQLSEKRGKSYKEIIYLSLLQKRLQKDLYESAFIF